MSEAVTTIVAALIGAVVGSAGAVLLAYILTQASEKRRRRDILVQQSLPTSGCSSDVVVPSSEPRLSAKPIFYERRIRFR